MLIFIQLRLASCLSNQHAAFGEVNIPIFYLNLVQMGFFWEKK